MKQNIRGAVGKVTRTLDKVERGGRQAWRLTALRSYDTSIDDAWDALTNPERIPRWFAEVSGDLQVGGGFQVKGNASGVIERCDPPKHFAITWEMHGDTSWVTVDLSEEQGRTLLTLQHVAHVPEAIFDQFGPGGVGVGWDLALLGLGWHLETGKIVDHAEAETWTLGDEGRVFVQGASSAWADASSAAGTDPEKAREAAARVVGFYSPETTDAS